MMSAHARTHARVRTRIYIYIYIIYIIYIIYYIHTVLIYIRMYGMQNMQPRNTSENRRLDLLLPLGTSTGSRITPAPYEKAQASDEEICKRAAHPSSKLNQKNRNVVLHVRACACLCLHVCMYMLHTC